MTAIAPVSLLALLFVLTALTPVLAATSTISIRDLAHLTPDIKFNGSSSYGFRPNSVSVGPGGIVSFTNVGLENHTVTSFSSRASLPFAPPQVKVPIPDGVIDSSPSVPNFSVEGGNFPDAIHPGQTFNVNTSSLAAGTYMIFCKFHPWMLGAIIVSLSGHNGATARIDDSARITNQPPFFTFAGAAEWGFISRTTTVKQGTIVVWTNDGNIPHTVTSGIPGMPGQGSTFNSGFSEDPAHFIFPGATFSVDTSGLSPGEYPYFCDIHEWMQGTLIVLG